MGLLFEGPIALPLETDLGGMFNVDLLMPLLECNSFGKRIIIREVLDGDVLDRGRHCDRQASDAGHS